MREIMKVQVPVRAISVVVNYGGNRCYFGDDGFRVNMENGSHTAKGITAAFISRSNSLACWGVCVVDAFIRAIWSPKCLVFFLIP